MAGKLKVDVLETVDASGSITVNNSITMASGKTLPATSLTGNLPAISAASLTAIPAGNLTGTVADARISALTASKLTGTIADARFPATLPAASAANLTAIPAANITGTLPAISGANLTGIVSLPAQSGHSGKYLTTNATAASWATVTVPTNITANAVDFGDWTITETSGVLYFATSGTNKMKLDASGNLTCVGDVTAYGSI